jgi:pimeloyl-ACP methyl ester carboxylesterase
MPYLSVAGQKTYFVRRDSIPPSQLPVVFIHGAGGSHQHWLYQVRDLSQAPTYALDLPGHGRSAAPGRDSVQAYSGWLVALLDALELERVVLVGHSMGGAIALCATLDIPDRIAGLGLLASGARLSVSPALLDAIRRDPEEAVGAICSSAFGPGAAPQMFQQGMQQMGSVPAGVLWGDFKACNDFDVMGRLGEIAVPTVVLCGTLDTLTPAKYSFFLRDHIPGAQLHLVEGSGHMVMLEKPGEVLKALGGWLNSL